jgi:phospholipid transport system transporter-binding protein
VQLSQAEIIQQNQQKYFISGTVDFSTAPDLVQRLLNFFKTYDRSQVKSTVTVDLSQLTSCNSAGLAMMLEMVKDARIYNIECFFDNLPDTLRTIAKAYGVENEIRDICK